MIQSIGVPSQKAVGIGVLPSELGTLTGEMAIGTLTQMGTLPGEAEYNGGKVYPVNSGGRDRGTPG